MQPANNGQPAAKGKKLRQVHATNQVAHLWANGVDRYICNANCTASTSPDGRVLFSYAQAIAARTDTRDADGRKVYLFRVDSHSSNTTQRHVRNCVNAIPFHVYYSSYSSRVGVWNGHRETIADAVKFYSTGDTSLAPPAMQTISFYVKDVRAEGGVAHAANYREMFKRAEAAALHAATRRVHFYPATIAEAFMNARVYRQIFCADYSVDLEETYDWSALAASFAKVIARKAKATAEAAARKDAYEALEEAWMTAVAPTLTDLAALLRGAAFDGAKDIREAVIAFEATGVWAHESTGSPAEARVHAVIAALIRDGAGGFIDAAERVGLKVLPAFSLPVDGAIRPPCRAMVRCYPKPQTRKVFGRVISDEYPQTYKVYEAVGLERRSNAKEAPRCAVGRDLLYAAREEVITSGGARVPLGIVAALWRRHGAEIDAAAASPVALFFPEARRVGAFSWIGYAAASPLASTSLGGSSSLMIGCHLVAAQDVARLARRLGWPEPEASA